LFDAYRSHPDCPGGSVYPGADDRAVDRQPARVGFVQVGVPAGLGESVLGDLHPRSREISPVDGVAHIDARELGVELTEQANGGDAAAEQYLRALQPGRRCARRRLHDAVQIRK